MAKQRLHILVAEPSPMIRRGLVSMLFDIDLLSIEVLQIEDLTTLKQTIVAERPDVVVVNPMHLGMVSPNEIIAQNVKIRFIALQSYAIHGDILKGYDATIAITDSLEQLSQTLTRLVGVSENHEEELSAREREVVAAIALGQSNKEIAEQLFISTHTVMTHRKNIANKLKIHNPAGLTIYAIVNKLINIEDIK